MFDLYRSDTSRSELAELAKQANPDEIDIDDDEDEDAEDGEPDGLFRWDMIGVLDPLTLHKLFDFELQLLIFYMRVISEVQLEQKSVPTAVFGGLKDD